jgi:hypothetical protein
VREKEGERGRKIKKEGEEIHTTHKQHTHTQQRERDRRQTHRQTKKM